MSVGKKNPDSRRSPDFFSQYKGLVKTSFRLTYAQVVIGQGVGVQFFISFQDQAVEVQACR